MYRDINNLYLAYIFLRTLILHRHKHYRDSEMNAGKKDNKDTCCFHKFYGRQFLKQTSTTNLYMCDHIKLSILQLTISLLLLYKYHHVEKYKKMIAEHIVL